MPQIDTDTLSVLEGLSFTGTSATIVRKLDRTLYTKVNKVLEAAGGKWSRKAKAHVFTEDPQELIEQIVLTGEYRREKQELGVFYTPAELAQDVAGRAGILPDQRWLEPSAGMGALAMAAASLGAAVTCMDILPKHVEACRKLGFEAHTADFLQVEPRDFVFGDVPPFDGVIMNPPFAKMADAQHFLQARRFVRKGGKVVSVMSSALTFRDTAAYRMIREFVKLDGGTIESLPAGSFKESGTMVNTCLVVLPVQ